MVNGEAGLWGDIVEAKYFKGRDPLRYKTKVTDSYTLKSIAHGINVIARGISWAVHSGNIAKF